MNAFWVVLAFAALVAVPVVIYVVARRRRKRAGVQVPPSSEKELARAVETVRERATSTSTEKVGVVVQELLVLKHEGLDVTMRYSPPAPKRSATVRFSTGIERMFLSPKGAEGPYRAGGQDPVAVLDHRPEVFFRKEGGLDGLGKGLAINRELQTGDAAFDEAVYVRSETERPVLEALLARQKTRAAVQGLVEAGFVVYLNGPTAELTLTRVNPDAGAIMGEALEALLQDMAALVQGLPLVESTSPLPRPNRGRTMLLAAYVLGFLGLGAFVLKAMLDDWPWQVIRLGALMGRGALPGLAIWIVFVVALLVLVRGRSHAMSYLIQGGVAMLIGLTGAGAVTAYVLNGALDSSKETVRNVRVVRRSISGNKNKSYNLHMKSWIPGVDEVKVEVPWGIYQSFSNPHSKRWIPGEITTRAGYLGYSWMTGIRRVSLGTMIPSTN